MAGTCTSRNITTRTVAVASTSWQRALDLTVNRVWVRIKNAGSDAVHLSTNPALKPAEGDPAPTEPTDTTSIFKLKADEEVYFEPGTAPSQLFVKAAASSSSLHILEAVS